MSTITKKQLFLALSFSTTSLFSMELDRVQIGQTQYEQAGRLLKEKKFKESIATYKQAAANGNAEAQFNLAGSYYAGTYVAQNMRVALQYYKAAAEQGHVRAQYSYGTIIFGLRNFPDKSEAIKCFHAAAEQNHRDAQFALGNLYLAGYETQVQVNFVEAEKWLLKAARQGHEDAQFTLGQLYMQSEDDNRCRLAVELLTPLAEAGSEKLQNLLVAILFHLGETERSREWMERAAKQGNKAALAALKYDESLDNTVNEKNSKILLNEYADVLGNVVISAVSKKEEQQLKQENLPQKLLTQRKQKQSKDSAKNATTEPQVTEEERQKILAELMTMRNTDKNNSKPAGTKRKKSVSGQQKNKVSKPEQQTTKTTTTTTTTKIVAKQPVVKKTPEKQTAVTVKTQPQKAQKSSAVAPVTKQTQPATKQTQQTKSQPKQQASKAKVTPVQKERAGVVELKAIENPQPKPQSAVETKLDNIPAWTDVKSELKSEIKAENNDSKEKDKEEVKEEKKTSKLTYKSALKKGLTKVKKTFGEKKPKDSVQNFAPNQLVNGTPVGQNPNFGYSPSMMFNAQNLVPSLPKFVRKAVMKAMPNTVRIDTDWLPQTYVYQGAYFKTVRQVDAYGRAKNYHIGYDASLTGTRINKLIQEAKRLERTLWASDMYGDWDVPENPVPEWMEADKISSDIYQGGPADYKKIEVLTQRNAILKEKLLKLNLVEDANGEWHRVDGQPLVQIKSYDELGLETPEWLLELKNKEASKGKSDEKL